MSKWWPTIVTALWGAYTIGVIVLLVFVQLTGQLSGKLLLPLTTIVFFLFSLAHAAWNLGPRNALLLLVTIFAISLLFESINIVSGGWVFGPLHYTPKLGIRAFDLVPLMIPMTWFTVGYLSLLVAERMLRPGPSAPGRTLKTALLAAAVLTAWDTGMDPIMVNKGYWVWEARGHYFGIPIRNYLGWLITSLCFFAVYLSLAEIPRPVPVGRDRRRMALMPPLAYALLWITNAVVNLDLGQTGPAIIGSVAMGPFAVYWLGSVYRENRAAKTKPGVRRRD